MTYMWKLIYSTDEPIYRTETDSEIRRADFWLPRGRGREWIDWDSRVNTSYCMWTG